MEDTYFGAVTFSQDIQTKALQSGTIAVDKAKGIVEAYAAAIGNKDSVGDIIVPGAFNASFRKRKPRVVWGHNWNEPVGKVLEIYEIPAGDPRLPAKMKAAGVGGLYVKAQFNLASERGREAFASVVFFGEEQEWCVDDKTEILTDRGWLKYDEVNDGDMAYVLDPEFGFGKFEKIDAINVWPEKEREMRLIETDNHSSLTTAAHRWPIVSNKDGGKVEWTTTEDLKVQDRFLRAAPRADAPGVQKYSDTFVELVGWFWTEGWVPPEDHTDSGLYVAQSMDKNPQYVAAIRAALEVEFPGKWSERHSEDNMARFRLTRSAAETILEVTGEGKAPKPSFLLNLTKSQLSLLVDTCMAGDGHKADSGQSTWYQVSDNGVRMFEMLCALAGRPTNTTDQKDYGNRHGEPPHRVSLLKHGTSGPLAAIKTKEYGYKDGKERTPATDEWVKTDGIVWCPTTPSTTWLARRNGTVYFTGNSIGYKTRQKTYDPARDATILKEVELYEVSPVLHGANQLTSTVSVKDAQEEKACDATGMGMLTRYLAQAVGKPVRIRHADGNQIVFTTPEGGTFVTSFSISDGDISFRKPIPARVSLVVQPLQEGSEVKDQDEEKTLETDDFEEGTTGFTISSGGSSEFNSTSTVTVSAVEEGKSEIWDNVYVSDNVARYEEKVGRMISGRNMQRLQAAVEKVRSSLDDLQALIDAATPQEQKSLYETYADAGYGTAVIGRDGEMAGVVLRIGGEFDSKELLDALSVVTDKMNAAVKVVGDVDGNVEFVELYPAAKTEAETLSETVDILAGFDSDISAKLDTLDFYGMSTKSLSDIFVVK